MTKSVALAANTQRPGAGAVLQQAEADYGYGGNGDGHPYPGGYSQAGAGAGTGTPTTGNGTGSDFGLSYSSSYNTTSNNSYSNSYSHSYSQGQGQGLDHPLPPLPSSHSHSQTDSHFAQPRNDHFDSPSHLDPYTSSPHIQNNSYDSNLDSQSSSAFGRGRSSYHSYNSTAPILPNAASLEVPVSDQHNPPHRGHKSEFYDDLLGGYIDSYTAEDQQRLSRAEPQMASYHNNQYGSSTPARSQAQQNYQRAPNDAHYDQYGYDSRQQYSEYNSPYRDDRSTSPDMHPGMGYPSSSSRGQPYSDQSPSRSQGYDQQRGNNYGPAAAAVGAAGIAAAVGSHQGRNYNGDYSAVPHQSLSPERSSDYHNYNGRTSPYGPYNSQAQSPSPHASYNSADNLTSSAAAPSHNNGHGYDNGYDQSRQYDANQQHPYQNPFDNHSISRNNFIGADYVDPRNIADDGDIGLEYQGPKRRSMIAINRQSFGMRSNTALGAAGAAGAAGMAASAVNSQHRSGGTGETSRGMYDDLSRAAPNEKATDFNQFTNVADDEGKSRKKKKIFLIILAVLILCGIAGGVVAAILLKKKGDDAASSGSSSAANAADGPILDKSSPSIKKLMNNKNLHKVFMGMAYTPMNSQYPDCLHNKPSQNNVTMDMAILSQLTNVIRLYGTDCGQTELVLTAIDKLGLTDMKVWPGIWLDKNTTTNARQIDQFWEIVDKFGVKHLKGVAVGNEVLYRKDLSIYELKNVISQVRTNMTSKGINLQVASSDLGDNWTAELAAAVDVVMSNVHPFFGGLTVDKAAGWTWDFWQSHDVILTQGTTKGNVISEVGWPSQGGNICGATACPDSKSGSVAGIPQLNTFMESWICQALSNGTEYFWFELLDEPWKVVFNTPGKEWEDHWGLFDVNRNLKPGVKIPDCSGKTIPTQK